MFVNNRVGENKTQINELQRTVERPWPGPKQAKAPNDLAVQNGEKTKLHQHFSLTTISMYTCK